MISKPTIADIHFEYQELLSLLELDDANANFEECTRYGWSTASSIWLSDNAGRIERLHDPSLIIALHSTDNPSIHDQIELEFVLHDALSLTSLIVPISTFFEAILDPLFQNHKNLPKNVVFALCNPLSLPLHPAGQLPNTLIGRWVFFAKGDVEAWLDWPDETHERVRLHSNSWDRIQDGVGIDRFLPNQ